MKTTNFTSPKHGAVIHLTKKEAEKLARHWGLICYFRPRGITNRDNENMFVLERANTCFFSKLTSAAK